MIRDTAFPQNCCCSKKLLSMMVFFCYLVFLAYCEISFWVGKEFSLVCSPRSLTDWLLWQLSAFIYHVIKWNSQEIWRNDVSKDSTNFKHTFQSFFALYHVCTLSFKTQFMNQFFKQFCRHWKFKVCLIRQSKFKVGFIGWICSEVLMEGN